MDIEALDRGSREPLHQQLYSRLRNSILSGRLQPGTRLPPTRALQDQLGVARNTVMNAYTQLLAEGYIEGIQGSGTYVARILPDDLVSTPRSAAPTDPVRHSTRLMSERGRRLAQSPAMPSLVWRKPRPFYPGVPAYEHLPMQAWRRLTSQHWKNPTDELLGYGTPHGYRPLRVAIADHLNSVRGVNCDPEQVIVVSGSQQALDLAARVLLDDGDDVWIENPAYPGARSALVGAGANLVPIPVDEQGLDVETAISAAPHARLAYVTPSHQYPLGATMSIARRLQLLRWADKEDSWIIEDDYDSEFRYSGRLFPALQGLDAAGRVIYVGTFSKVLFPSLRLGYVVVSPELVDGFLAARAVTDRHPPTVEQAILAEFIADGHFLRHVRRMRALYSARQEALVDAVGRWCDGLIELGPDEAGMHLIAWLPPDADDIATATRCSEFGLSTPPLSHYYHAGTAPRPGLLLGYTGYDQDVIETSTRQLAAALRSLAPTR